MGLVAPPPGSPLLLRIRGILLIILIVVALIAIGFGIVQLIALPFGGVGIGGGLLLGVVLVIAVLAVLALFGRRRQNKAAAARAAG